MAMNNYQGVLDSITSMQQNAQAALPVIPNNGNPQGANNMQPAMPTVGDAWASVVTGNPPQQSVPVPMPKPAGPPPAEQFYPWMAPSPYMGSILSRIQGMPQPNPPAVQPAAPAQIQAPNRQLPVMPELGPVRTANNTWTQVR